MMLFLVTIWCCLPACLACESNTGPLVWKTHALPIAPRHLKVSKSISKWGWVFFIVSAPVSQGFDFEQSIQKPLSQNLICCWKLKFKNDSSDTLTIIVGEGDCNNLSFSPLYRSDKHLTQRNYSITMAAKSGQSIYSHSLSQSSAYKDNKLMN